jgi:hypothetical protein
VKVTVSESATAVTEPTVIACAPSVRFASERVPDAVPPAANAMFVPVPVMA